MLNISLVVADTASLTPLFSWLKGAPPGINPSSYQQKKKCIPPQFVTVTSFSPSTMFSLSPCSSFPLLRLLVSPLCTNPTSLKLLPSSLRGQPGHSVRLAIQRRLSPLPLPGAAKLWGTIASLPVRGRAKTRTSGTEHGYPSLQQSALAAVDRLPLSFVPFQRLQPTTVSHMHCCNRYRWPDWVLSCGPGEPSLSAVPTCRPGATYVGCCRGSPATLLSLGTLLAIASPFLKLSIPLFCVGPACGILSGSSSFACQFSHHSLAWTHLRIALYLPTSFKLHLLVTSHPSNPTLSIHRELSHKVADSWGHVSTQATTSEARC